jgi:hypothetical protein
MRVDWDHEIEYGSDTMAARDACLDPPFGCR